MADGPRPPRAPLPPGEPALPRALGAAATGLLALLVLATPLACIPPSLFPGFHAITPSVFLAKEWVIRALCAGILGLAALRLLAGGACWPGRAALAPALALAGYAGWSLLAAVRSGAPASSLEAFRNEGLLLLASLAASTFLVSPRHLRVVLGAAVLGGVAVASITVASWLGFRGLNVFIYGGDIAGAAIGGADAALVRTEGGAARAAALATLGNPEYTGNYLAAVLLLVGCFLLDGWGAAWARRPWAWGAGLLAAGLLMVALAATGTRGAWVVVLAGMVVAWLLGASTRAWMIAAWVAATAGAGIVMGFLAGVAMFALGAAALAALQARGGELARRFRAMPVRNRALLLSGPLLGVLLFAAFSTPGPWNPRGLQLAQRFAEGLSVADNSVRERVIFHMVAGELAFSHPLLGVGPGQYEALFSGTFHEVAGRDASGALEYLRVQQGGRLARHAHGDFFEVAAEQGLVGLALLCALLVALLWRCAALARGWGDGAWAGPARAAAVLLSGFAAMMLTSFPLGEGSRLALWAGAGLACALAACRGLKNPLASPAAPGQPSTHPSHPAQPPGESRLP